MPQPPPFCGFAPWPPCQEPPQPAAKTNNEHVPYVRHIIKWWKSLTPAEQEQFEAEDHKG